MKFPGRSQLSSEYVSGVWGKEIKSDTDRPFGLIDAQHYAAPEKVGLARAWFTEVHRDELTPVGSLGRRFSYQGSEYFLDESQSVLANPSESAVELLHRRPVHPIPQAATGYEHRDRPARGGYRRRASQQQRAHRQRDRPSASAVMSRRKHWSSDPNYPQRDWTRSDWADWEEHGRPRVPVRARLSADGPKRLDGVPVVQPLHPLGGFDLYAKPRPRHQSARSASIDRLLEALGLSTPRRRTR